MTRIVLEISDAARAFELLEYVRQLQYVDYASADLPTELAAVLAGQPADKLWTYSEMCRLFPAESRLELIQNQLFAMPSPTPEHQNIVFELAFRIKSFLREKEAQNEKIGEVFISPLDVKLDENNVVQPDIVFLKTENADKIKEKCVEGAPDLVVEVESAGNKKRESEKKKLYESAGVPEYWTVRPEEQLLRAESLENGRYETHSEAVSEGSVFSKILKGFSVRAERIFGK